MNATKTLAKMIGDLQRYGFEPVSPDGPSEISLWRFRGHDKLEVAFFSHDYEEEVHVCLNWYRDPNNFSMIPFDLYENNSDLVRVEAFEITLREYTEKSRERQRTSCRHGNSRFGCLECREMIRTASPIGKLMSLPGAQKAFGGKHLGE